MQTDIKLANGLERAKVALAHRPHLPGEQWMTLAAGISVWLATREHRSLVVRLAGSVVGTLIVAHTAMGRQGLEKVTRHMPFSDRLRH